MFSTQKKGCVGTGAQKFSSTMADSKKGTDKQYLASDSKTNLHGSGPSGV